MRSETFEEMIFLSISSFQCKKQTKPATHKSSEVQGNSYKARSYSDI